jgi:hypothetical protein
VREEKRFQQKSQRAAVGAAADVVLESHQSEPSKGYLRGGPHTNVGNLEQREKNIKYTSKSSVPSTSSSKLMQGHWEAIADYMLQSDLLGAENDDNRQQAVMGKRPPFNTTMNSSSLSSPIRTAASSSSSVGPDKNNLMAEQRRQSFEKRYQARHGQVNSDQGGVSGGGGEGVSGGAGGARRPYNYSGWMGDFGNLNSFTVPLQEDNQVKFNTTQVPSSSTTTSSRHHGKGGGSNQEGKHDNDDYFENDHCGQGDDIEEEEEGEGKTEMYQEEGKDQDDHDAVYDKSRRDGRAGKGSNQEFSYASSTSVVNESVAAPWTSPLEFDIERKDNEDSDL